MNKIDCILYIDQGTSNQLEVDGQIREIIEVETIEHAHHIETALEFIERGCIIDGHRCPEFIFIDLGSRSIHQKDSFNAFQKINDAIVIKIQVVFLLDENNTGELEDIKKLGIHYIFKPLDKSKLQSVFDRYFRLKNPIF